MSTPIPALFIAFLEPGPSTSLDEFHEWYNTEHIPIVQTCPGFRTFARYTALDGRHPLFAAIYDLDSAAALQSERLLHTSANRSAREARILGETAAFEMRTYVLDEPEPAPAPPQPAGAIVLDSVTPAGENDFAARYNAKVKDLKEAEGFLRVRRYKLVNFIDQVNEGVKPPPAYLFLQEFAPPDELQAVKQGWDGNVKETERRELSLLKVF